MSATLSQSRPASSMKWVTSTIVTPLSRTLSIRPHVSRRGSGSSPVVSSSKTAAPGWPIKASTMESRCSWPPDSAIAPEDPEDLATADREADVVVDGRPVGLVQVLHGLSPAPGVAALICDRASVPSAR